MSGQPKFVDVRFKAEDNEGSTQYIGTLEDLPEGELRFKLKPGVTFEQAERLADELERFVAKVSVTT